MRTGSLKAAEGRQRLLPHRPMRRLLPHVLLFVSLLVISWWSQHFSIPEPEMVLFWPATGLGLGFLFRYGYSLAGPLFAGALIAHLLAGADPFPAAIMSAGNVAGAVVGVTLLARTGFDRHLERLRDVLLLLAVGAVATASVSAMAAGMAMAGLQTGFHEVAFLCWIADMMGLALLAPLVLTLPGIRTLRRLDWEVILLASLAPLYTWFVYADLFPEGVALPLTYLLFPLVMLTALRHPPPAVAAVLAAISMVALQCTGSGKGPFALEDKALSLISLHAQLGLLVLTGLVLAAVRAQQMASESRARRHLEALTRAGRLNAMGTLAAGMAHELNQPLAAVSSYARAAQRMLRQGHQGEELQQTLDQVVTGTSRASGIVRRARGMLSRDPAQRRECDLNHLIREVVALMRPELRRREVALDLDLSDALPTVRIDSVEFQQVLVNILENALEAVAELPDPGRRWIRVRTRGHRDADALHLSITDGGEGLPVDDPDTLFEPLVTNRRDGTGLGLAIARAIVEDHGGSLTATNSVGAGAVFRIRIPFSAPSDADAKKEQPGEQ